MKKTKSKLSFFTKLLLFINCGVALCLLISYLAPVTDPRKFWPVAFFGLAYPPVLLLNVLFVIYWIVARSKFVLISIVTIVAGYGVLRNNIGFSFGSDNVRFRQAGHMRVLTYNVHNFRKDGKVDHDSTRHGILQLMSDIKPDVIGMQEYFYREKGRYAMNDSISDLLKTKYRHFEPNAQNEREGIGVCIFSRFPIISKGSVAVSPPGSGIQCIYADIKAEGKIIRFYSVHLQSIQFEAEDYRYIDTITNSGKPDLSSTKRLGSKLKRAFLKRAEQVEIIKQHAEQCPYPYIISGDFNDTPTSFAVNIVAKGMQNAFRVKGFGLGRTYNGSFPNYQIDYVMASEEFKVLSHNIVKAKLSDHYPVYADLILK